MGHALIASWGGIPLLYMGDELAMLNDEGYRDVPEHAHDSRWIHRPRMDWDAAAARHVAETPSARVFRGVRHILARRAATQQLHGGVPTEVIEPPAPGVFAFVRRSPLGPVLCLSSFTESWLHLPLDWALAQGVTLMHDALSDAPVTPHGPNVALPPYARVWLT
jgi:amylosucrase